MQSCTAYYASITVLSNKTGIKNYRGQMWVMGDHGYTLFNTIVPPNSRQHRWSACHFGCAGCALEGSSFINALSNHPGGCNFVMADGSVRFIKDAISMTTYWSLGTRAGGEPVDAARISQHRREVAHSHPNAGPARSGIMPVASDIVSLWEPHACQGHQR